MLGVLVVLLICGCGGGQNLVEVEEVVSLEIDGVRVVMAEEALGDLVREFNEAKTRRTGNSGLATHRLVIITADGARYSMYRIDEETVEVGLRLGDVRKKFFLISPTLSQQILTICQEESIKAGP